MSVDIDTTGLCLRVIRTGQLCVTFPGGVEICAYLGIDKGAVGEVIRSLLAGINTALAPLQPFFNVLDVVIAIVTCIQAIPDMVAIPPDPSKFFNCIPGLLEAIEKVIGLPLQIPKMIKQIILIIIEAILTIIGEIEAFIDYELDILSAGTEPAWPGNLALTSILDCETGNFDLQLHNLNESLKPLNRLIGFINFFVYTFTGQQLPTFADLGTAAKDAIQPMKDTLATIVQIVNIIPG